MLSKAVLASKGPNDDNDESYYDDEPFNIELLFDEPIPSSDFEGMEYQLSAMITEPSEENGQTEAIVLARFQTIEG